MIIKKKGKKENKKISHNFYKYYFLFDISETLNLSIDISCLFLFEKYIIKIMIIAINVPTTVIFICPAPQPKPTAIIKNKNTNSSGSLMAALNLTIDNAPTKPSDKAKDDFTIVIIIVVVNPNTIKFLEKFSELDKLLLVLL